MLSVALFVLLVVVFGSRHENEQYLFEIDLGILCSPLGIVQHCTYSDCCVNFCVFLSGNCLFSTYR